MNARDIKSHLSGFKVGIAGAGGLGSNCAVALARSGVGTLVLCDFDIVEIANLNRQYYFRDQAGEFKTKALKENIMAIDDSITVLALTEKLDEENIPVIFEGCDIIVEAFDTAEMKRMLIETVQTRMKGTPVIVGSGMAGWGESNALHCRMLDESLIVCGDEQTQSGDLPLLAPRVAIVANMQANAVLEILLKKVK